MLQERKDCVDGAFALRTFSEKPVVIQYGKGFI
jgi:hypothetical protein